MEDESSDPSLLRLQNLQQDLEFLASSQLPNLERLVLELQDSIQDFRNLLQSKAKNDASRQKLNSGKFESDNVEYSINDDFKQRAMQVADALDIDEIDAAVLFLQGQALAESYDRPDYWCAINLFNQKRQILLECLQRAVGFSISETLDDELATIFREVVSKILGPGEGQTSSATSYTKRCLDAMSDIQKRLQHIAERLQSVAMTNQVQSETDIELVNIQRDSLLRQHELLSIIVTDLSRANHASVSDAKIVISRLKAFDRFDVTLIHYIPCLASFLVQLGPSDAFCPIQEARTLDQAITNTRDTDAWTIRSLQAAATVLWLVQYSGRFHDNLLPDSDGQQADLEAQAERRESQFMESLRDGAFQFILAACQALRREATQDSARKDWLEYLMNDMTHLQLDHWKFDEEFKKRLSQGLQLFAEGFISWMPDVLRTLKFEEDEQRRQIQSRIQLRPAEYQLHLERFLTIISYAYENDPDAASTYWTDVDNNFYGFLQWASTRQTTPRVAAFCEMLKAIACGEENADAAHSFLLDEGHAASARLRRNSPLAWHDVYNELDYFVQSSKDRPAPAPASGMAGTGPQADLIVESETGMMLQSYLHLIAHFARQSPRARSFFLSNPTFDMQEHILYLCSGSIDSRLRGSAFNALSALLTDKTRESQHRAWATLDAWVSGNAAISANYPRQILGGYNIPTEQLTFEIISTGFDEAKNFVRYLIELVSPPTDDQGMTESLPFPEALGQTYRMPGIDPYVDFVMERIFARKTTEISDETQIHILRLHCLHFALWCLNSFNEDLVAYMKRTTPLGDQAQQDSRLGTYIRLHPFARTMEWMFNENVLEVLLSTVIQDENVVNKADPDSPMVNALAFGVELIRKVIELRSTYSNIVRPAIKLSGLNRQRPVANPALLSYEDVIMNRLEIVPHLGYYATSGHQDLAINSLNLLKKLASFRKLNAPGPGGNRTHPSRSKLLTALENADHAERISRGMFATLLFDPRQLIAGDQAPGYQMKMRILGFLRQSLETTQDRPNIAHLLLGFQYQGGGLIPSQNMLEGRSLFHVIMGLVLQCPEAFDNSYLGWLLSLRNEAFQVLRLLWRSPVTKAFVIPDLTANDFVFGIEHHRNSVSPHVLWNQLDMENPLFFASETGSAAAVSEALQIRGAYLECVAVECYDAHLRGLSTLTSRLQDLILSTPANSAAVKVGGPTVLNLLDFLELPETDIIPLPESKFITSAELDTCAVEEDNGSLQYDLRAVQQMLVLKENELFAATGIQGTPEEDQFHADSSNILQCLDMNNNRAGIQRSKTLALQAWVQLVVILLDCTTFQPAQKYATISQILQAVLPRFQAALVADVETAEILAQLMTSLLRATDFAYASASDAKTIDIGDDRFFQLMKVALTGISGSDMTTSLRERCYQIVHAYVRGVSRGSKHTAARHYTLQSIRSAGRPLMETLCDEAYSGDGSARDSALLLLSAMVMIANAQGSKYMIEAFDRINFIQAIVNNLKGLPEEVGAAQQDELSSILVFHDMSLALLLCVAEAKVGANAVLNADFFGAIRESGIFDADPDIGLGADNADALRKFFELMLSLLRIMSAILVNHGAHEQVLTLVRRFLDQYRPSVVAIFKRHAGIGSLGKDNEGLIDELVDNWTFLISQSGFLDTQAENDGQKDSRKVFL